jgi:hypothetical protein
MLTQQTKHGCGENTCDVFQFGKRDGQQPLDITLDRRHLVHKTLPLSGEISEIREVTRSNSLTQGLSVQKKELGNHACIFLVCFGLPQLKFHKIGNEQGINHDHTIP